MKKILYIFIFVLAFLLIGCSGVDNQKENLNIDKGTNLYDHELPKVEDPSFPDVNDSKKEDPILTDPTIDDFKQDEEGIEVEYSFDYVNKTYINRGFEGFLFINSYEDYLKAIDDGHITIGRLDEEYFKTMGLVIYGKWEGSGSIKVSLKSLVLNEEGILLVRVQRNIPELGTADMRYHGFVINFVKPDREIKGAELVFHNIRITVKYFNISTSEGTREIVDKFIAGQGEKIVNANVTLWFKEGKKDTSKYDFSKIGGYFSELSSLSFSMISFNNLKDLNLDALYEFAYLNDFEKISLSFSYEVFESERNPIF